MLIFQNFHMNLFKQYHYYFFAFKHQIPFNIYENIDTLKKYYDFDKIVILLTI
jgi:hypothetical protein